MWAGFEGKRLLIPVALFLFAGVTSAISSAGGYVASLPMLMNPTADVAMIFFSAAFAASSLVRLMPNDFTRFLMRNRRYIGLSFALVHFAHLVLVLSNITMVAGNERTLGSLVPGAIAYAFLAAMTLTSNNASVRALGAKRWKWLHKIGSYYIWLLFFIVTLPPSLDTAWRFALSLVVLGLRITAWNKGRKKKAAAG